MTDLLSALAIAFKARDIGTLHTFRRDVVAAADLDLTGLYIAYAALMAQREEEADWRGRCMGVDVPDNTPLIEALDANLARLDTAWTAYLALRAQQQEPEGV